MTMVKFISRNYPLNKIYFCNLLKFGDHKVAYHIFLYQMVKLYIWNYVQNLMNRQHQLAFDDKTIMMRMVKNLNDKLK